MLNLFNSILDHRSIRGAHLSNKNFILVTRDGESSSGSTISAEVIIKKRLDENSWPIYENTRGRKSFEKGSKVAFYIGGSSLSAGNIIATAIIEKIHKPSNISLITSDDELIEEPPYINLCFEKIQYLKKPINFRSKLELLSFCPKNLQKWGVVLIGGCRQLNDTDWNRIFK